MNALERAVADAADIYRNLARQHCRNCTWCDELRARARLIMFRAALGAAS